MDVLRATQKVLGRSRIRSPASGRQGEWSAAPIAAGSAVSPADLAPTVPGVSAAMRGTTSPPAAVVEGRHEQQQGHEDSREQEQERQRKQQLLMQLATRSGDQWRRPKLGAHPLVAEAAPAGESEGQVQESVQAVAQTSEGSSGAGAVAVVFAQPGPLGLQFAPYAGGGPVQWVQLLGLTAGTQAEQHPELTTGLLLDRVAGQPVEALPYAEAIAAIKANGRPVELSFCRVPQRAMTMSVGRAGGAMLTASPRIEFGHQNVSSENDTFDSADEAEPELTSWEAAATMANAGNQQETVATTLRVARNALSDIEPQAPRPGAAPAVPPPVVVAAVASGPLSASAGLRGAADSPSRKARRPAPAAASAVGGRASMPTSTQAAFIQAFDENGDGVVDYADLKAGLAGIGPGAALAAGGSGGQAQQESAQAVAQTTAAPRIEFGYQDSSSGDDAFDSVEEAEPEQTRRKAASDGGPVTVSAGLRSAADSPLRKARRPAPAATPAVSGRASIPTSTQAAFIQAFNENGDGVVDYAELKAGLAGIGPGAALAAGGSGGQAQQESVQAVAQTTAAPRIEFGYQDSSSGDDAFDSAEEAEPEQTME
jgi:hypothetical protein